jgi:hypothetical protein
MEGFMGVLDWARGLSQNAGAAGAILGGASGSSAGSPPPTSFGGGSGGQSAQYSSTDASGNIDPTQLQIYKDSVINFTGATEQEANSALQVAVTKFLKTVDTCNKNYVDMDKNFVLVTDDGIFLQAKDCLSKPLPIKPEQIEGLQSFLNNNPTEIRTDYQAKKDDLAKQPELVCPTVGGGATQYKGRQ